MLAENFPDLQKLYGQGALSGYLGGQQIDAARKSQQINQQGALQEMFWKDQSMPADIGYKVMLIGAVLTASLTKLSQSATIGVA